ncbi:MAG: phage terminase large subunit family protein [Patescibacteria group bacterium]|nr:phage terminase large subunit family protein [Patescibacteria group bacterium]
MRSRQKKKAFDSSLLKPPPRLRVSEWAEASRILSSEASASPGKWYNATAPYLVGIMDAFNDPLIERVVVMSSAQIGKSEVLLNILGYTICNDPGPCLLVQPTTLMAEAFVKDRLLPMVRDCPALHGKVEIERKASKMIQDTMLHRSFPGGHVTLAGANSPASLASRPIRFLFLDEVDRYPLLLKQEGDVVALATKRTTAFYNRKIVMTSTPTVKGASRIESEWEASDQRRFFVPCPHCGHRQHLQFGSPALEYGLKWEKGSPEHCWYECESCHEAILPQQRAAMIAQGEWKPTREAKVCGFHINELASPFVTWHEMILDFLDAKRSPETLRTFVNTALGESWSADDEPMDEQQISLRAENYSGVPEGVLVITAGVDVQGDRVEGEFVGWGKNHESWGIERFAIAGDPAQEQIWEQLDTVLRRHWSLPSGASIGVAAACVDSGYLTDQVYRFTKARLGRRVFAIKGVPGSGKSLVGKPLSARSVLSRKIKVFPVSTDAGKDVLFAHLAVLPEEMGSGPYMHFPQSYAPEFYEQLTAEKAILRHKGGVGVRTYVKIRQRNEALDIRLYARAALEILKIDVDRLDEPFGVVKGQAIETPKAPERPNPRAQLLAQMQHRMPQRKSGWVNNW